MNVSKSSILGVISHCPALDIFLLFTLYFMKVYLNNKLYRVNTSEKKQITILQALETKTIQLPRFCYHEKLSIAGNCRMCFVELPKAKKPILGCSTAIHDGIELYTNTFVVKKAQESILEFLLLNHPLDCPICDQAGECDLQELTKNFGSDRGRFNEMKRSVEDLYLGEVIHTIMTRCIHCTRCIRFADEILAMPNLGTVGRGRDTEVSTFINKIMKTELSGNIVDLCPVGALTSKPYAFKARPWELKQVESIDILDSIGSALRFSVDNNKILRVLPVTNDLLNEDWITDKIRYFYDSISLQRLTKPIFLFKSKHYIIVEWDDIMNFLMKVICFFKNSIPIKLITGVLLDLSSILSLSYLHKVLQTNYLNNSNYDIDFRTQYLISNSLESVESRELYYILGSNLDFESPLLKLRIQKNPLSKKLKVMGSYWNSFITGTSHVSSTPIKKIIHMVEGRTYENLNLLLKNKIEFFFRLNSNFSIDNTFYSCYLSKLKYVFNINIKKYLHSYTNWMNINPLLTHSKFIHQYEVGFLKNIFTSSFYVIKQKYNIIKYNILDHTLIDKDSSFNIMASHHESNMSRFKHNIILPIITFLEKKSKYINNLGTMQSANKIVNRPGETKSIKGLSFLIIRSLEQFSVREIYIIFTRHLFKYKLRVINNFINLFNYLEICSVEPDFKLFHLFHASDMLTLSSPLMLKFSREKRNTESNMFYSNEVYSI